MLYKNYEYFLAIVKNQSITRAASELFISQPALSNYLKRLEKSLGIDLFDHTSLPLTLTCAGEYYLSYVNSLISMSKNLQDEFSEIKVFDRGKVTIGISPWRSSYILPEILPAFRKRYPHIEIVAEESVDNALYSLIESNLVDFSIKSLTYPNPKFEHEIIMNERILLAINKSNPLLERLGIKPTFDKNNIQHFDITEARDENFILPRPSQELHFILQKMLTINRMEPKGFETQNVATALNLVRENFGLTFVPEGRILHSHNFDNIVFFTVGNPILDWYFAIVYKKNTHLSKTSRIFINELKLHYPSQLLQDTSASIIT